MIDWKKKLALDPSSSILNLRTSNHNITKFLIVGQTIFLRHSLRGYFVTKRVLRRNVYSNETSDALASGKE